MQYIQNIYSLKEDLKLSNAVVSYFVLTALNSGLKQIFKIEGMLNMAITAVCLGIIILYLIFGLKIVVKRNSSLFCKSCGLFGFLYILSIALAMNRGEPTDLIINENAAQTFAFFIPVGLCACCINDYNILYRQLLKYSFLITIVCTLCFIYRNETTEYGLASYNMSFGFYLLLPLLLHYNEVRENKSKIFLALFVAELLMILIYGNRSVLLSILFFIFAGKFFVSQSTKQKIFITICIVFLLFFVILFYDQLMLLLAGVLQSTGTYSRTLSMMSANNLAESEERLELWGICGSMISENPVLGYGLGGEYYEIAKRFGGAIKDANIYYNPHNGLIQNFVNFGIFGGLIACYYCVKPVLGIGHIKNKRVLDITLIFVAAYIIPRLVSAAGFFIHPGVAIPIYLYFYRRNYYI